MNLSLSFILGLAVLVAGDHWLAPLPGQTYPYRFWWLALALVLPTLVATWTRGRLGALARLGEPPGPGLRALCRAQALTVPLGTLFLVDGGGLVAFAREVFGGSHFAYFATLLVALLLLEVSLRRVERHTVRDLEALRVAIPSGLLSGWSRMTAFVVVPILLFAAVLDLIETSRELAVFLHGTSAGATLGLLTAACLLAVTLPILFRLLLPTRRNLPWQVADDVRAAARRLDFSPSNILSLDTDHRMVNAALVGPFRWPRYLVLTDGLLSCLDGPALQGVVAHEVGHARAGHPALLLLVFGAIPILLLQPVGMTDLEAWPPELLILAGAGLALASFFALRWLMHRFEFEADQLSAAALGGAMPCIRALTRVGDLFPTQRGRTSFRHPSEEQRVRSLLMWETDPGHRVSFARRGRGVRLTIAALVSIAFAVSVWSHVRTWPLDTVVWHLYTGDFASAEQAVAKLDPPPPGVRIEDVESLAAEVRVAVALMGAGGDWDAVAPELADRAWRNAVALAAASGARTARPWFALASIGPEDDPVRESAWLWSRAVTDGDEAEAARLVEHLRVLEGVPEALLAAVGAKAGE